MSDDKSNREELPPEEELLTDYLERLLESGTRADFEKLGTPVQAALVDAWSRETQPATPQYISKGDGGSRLYAAFIVAVGMFVSSIVVGINIPDEVDVTVKTYPGAEINVDVDGALELEGYAGGPVEFDGTTKVRGTLGQSVPLEVEGSVVRPLRIQPDNP